MTIIRATVENLSTLQAVDAQTVERLAHALNLPAVGNEFTLDLAEAFLRNAIRNLCDYGVVARVSDWHVHRGGHHVALSHLGATTERVLFVTEVPAFAPEPVTFNFTVEFTRADEQYATVHTIGYNVEALDVATAERTLRLHFDHLQILSVKLAATLTADGDIIEADEIAAAGPGQWAVQFGDNSPVRVTVPAGQNLRQVIDQQWPGVSASGVAVQASPVAALPEPVAKSCWYCDQLLIDGRCPACDSPTLTPADWRNAPPVAAPEAAGATTAPAATPKAHADDAPTVAPAIAAGDDVDVFVNQATREGWVLAVLGDEYILEYTMPKGTTALQIRRVDGGSIKDGKWNGSYRNVSYKALPTRWLQAIVDAGSVWEGKAQGVYRAPWRGGYGGSNARVPSAADLLAAKKGGR